MQIGAATAHYVSFFFLQKNLKQRSLLHFVYHTLFFQ